MEKKNTILVQLTSVSRSLEFLSAWPGEFSPKIYLTKRDKK